MIAVRTLLLLVLMTTTIVAVGCNEDEETADESFTLASFENTCVPAALSSGVVVKTQEEYDDLTFPAECTPPSFDFAAVSLIGIRTSVGGCAVDYDRSIERNASTLTYRIRINATGTCEKLNTSNNWITVPKVGPNTEVVFDVQ